MNSVMIMGKYPRLPSSKASFTSSWNALTINSPMVCHGPGRMLSLRVDKNPNTIKNAMTTHDMMIVSEFNATWYPATSNTHWGT